MSKSNKAKPNGPVKKRPIEKFEGTFSNVKTPDFNDSALISAAMSATPLDFSSQWISWGSVAVARPIVAKTFEETLAAVSVPFEHLWLERSGAKWYPVTSTVERNMGLHTRLAGATFELRGTREEMIAKAKKAMLDLVEHEIDEWLFAAGLAEDPHARSNDVDRAIYEDLFISGALV